MKKDIKALIGVPVISFAIEDALKEGYQFNDIKNAIENTYNCIYLTTKREEPFVTAFFRIREGMKK